MRLPRIYTAAELTVAVEITLEKQASHHLVTVLRVKSGTQVLLFNGDGFDYLANIIEAGKSTRLEIISRQENPTESPLDISLLLASIRKDRMDYSIQKSVELGVDRIVVFHADLSTGKPLRERERRKKEHWQAVIRSAAEQSGRSRITTIDYAENLDAALDTFSTNDPDALCVLLNPNAEISLAARLHRYTEDITTPRTIVLAIGPESGFSANELRTAESSNFTSTSLGQRVLRAETAPVCALAVLQATLGDLA